jgi:hypothetical protein
MKHKNVNIFIKIVVVDGKFSSIFGMVDFAKV